MRISIRRRDMFFFVLQSHKGSAHSIFDVNFSFTHTYTSSPGPRFTLRRGPFFRSSTPQLREANTP